MLRAPSVGAIPARKQRERLVGDDYLQDESTEAVIADVVLEETVSYLDDEAESLANLFGEDDTTSDAIDAEASELDPVLSDIAEDIAVAWLD